MSDIAAGSLSNGPELTSVAQRKDAGTYEEEIPDSFTSDETCENPFAGVMLDSSRDGDPPGESFQLSGHYCPRCRCETYRGIPLKPQKGESLGEDRRHQQYPQTAVNCHPRSRWIE
jgi:hypothetical protein